MHFAAFRHGSCTTRTGRHAARLALYLRHESNIRNLDNRLIRRLTLPSSPPHVLHNGIQTVSKDVSHKERESNPKTRTQMEVSQMEQNAKLIKQWEEEAEKKKVQMTPQLLFSLQTQQILRHDARSLGYQIVPDGFVRVTDVLRHDIYRDYDFEKFADLCYNDPLDTFELTQLPDIVNGHQKDVWWVRTRKGHTIPEVDARSHRTLNMGKYQTLSYICTAEQWNFIHTHGIPEGPGNVIKLHRSIEGKLFREMRILSKALWMAITIDAEKAATSGVMFFNTWDSRILAVGDKNKVIPLDAIRSAVTLEIKKTNLLNR